MNKTEQRFAQLLESWRVMWTPCEFLGGIIKLWRFEKHCIEIAPRTVYWPDFNVLTTDGESIFVEVKARTNDGRVLWEDDARVKFKVAADLFDEYRFICASWNAKTGWEFEEINP